MDRFEPIVEPRIAKKTDGIPTFRLISLFFIKHTADIVAPKLAESLFVAIAACTGIPAIR